MSKGLNQSTKNRKIKIKTKNNKQQNKRNILNKAQQHITKSHSLPINKNITTKPNSGIIPLITYLSTDIFNTMNIQEQKQQISPTLLIRHSIQPALRNKYINWMYCLCKLFGEELQLFILSVYLFDSYIDKSQTIINIKDLELISLTCVYISTKFEEVKIPHINTLTNCNSHITREQINQKEVDILTLTNFQLLCVTTFHYVKLFLIDLQKNKKDNKYINLYEQICIFIVKFMILDESFYKYKQSLNSIAVLIVGLDLLTTNSKQLPNDVRALISKWVVDIIEKNKYDYTLIQQIREKLMNNWNSDNLCKCNMLNNDELQFD